jgi:hypothetical protein
MMTRRCTHCEAQFEVVAGRSSSCPTCGLDPDLPRLAFDDAPAFFLAGDPRHEPGPTSLGALPGS